LKQAGVILLMLMFTVSQYAMQFNYLECRLANAFSSSAIKCDCENEVKAVTETDKNLPVSKSHMHHYVDDFFTGNVVTVVHDHNENISSPHFSSITNHVITGYENVLYRPPRA